MSDITGHRSGLTAYSDIVFPWPPLSISIGGCRPTKRMCVWLDNKFRDSFVHSRKEHGAERSGTWRHFTSMVLRTSGAAVPSLTTGIKISPRVLPSPTIVAGGWQALILHIVSVYLIGCFCTRCADIEAGVPLTQTGISEVDVRLVYGHRVATRSVLPLLFHEPPLKLEPS